MTSTPTGRKVDRILTLNATGARGVNIGRDKYETMKKAILEVITSDREGTPFKDLSKLVKPLLPGMGFPPEASVSWYTTVVKLDLEARGLIERVSGARPQRVRRRRGKRKR